MPAVHNIDKKNNIEETQKELQLQYSLMEHWCHDTMYFGFNHCDQ